jgi:hypothetical protein
MGDIVIHQLEETKWEKIYWFLYGVFVRPFRNAKNYLRHRFINKFYLINTKLNPGSYYDIDTRMLYGMMNLLVEYIELENPMETISWTEDSCHFNARYTILNIYIWWKNYENRVKEIEDCLTAWSDKNEEERGNGPDGPGGWFANINKPQSKKALKLFDKLHELERKLAEEETEMLILLARIRPYLWT